MSFIYIPVESEALTNPINWTTAGNLVLDTSGSNVFRYQGSADSVITGLVAPTNAKEVKLVNNASIDNVAVFIELGNTSATSIIGWHGGSNVSRRLILTRGQSATLKYDTALQRWYVISNVESYFTSSANRGILALGGSGARTTAGFTTGTSYFYPFTLYRNTNFRQISYEVTAAGGANLRITIFNDNSSSASNGALTGNVVAALASGATNVVTGQSLFMSSPNILAPGDYWLQIQTDANISLRAFTQATEYLGIFGATSHNGYTVAEAYTVLPVGNRNLTNFVSIIVPLIYFR
jgi:hypothetical protein